MKQQLLPAIRLTIFCLLFFCGGYTLLLLGVAQAAPNKGLGQTIQTDGRVVGYRLEGQSFTGDQYFNGRPSAVGYNAAGSGGSNKGPSNPDYLKQLQERIDSFMVHNPGISKNEIPADLITASGSGLDPDISPEAAYVQVKRIAKARNISEEKIRSLIGTTTQRPAIGMQRVNVLAINIELDKLK